MSFHERSRQGPLDDEDKIVGFEQQQFEPLWPEALEQFPDGVWVPFSSLLTDFARPWFPPKSQDIFEVGMDILSSFPAEEPLCIRGSTWNYQLLRGASTERRGTLPMAIAIGFAGEIQRQAHTRTAQTLNKLAYFSDFDFFLPTITAEEFGEVNEKIWANIGEKAGARAVVPGFGKKAMEPSIIVSRHKAEMPLSSANGRERLNIVREDGTVDTIPYSQASVEAQNSGSIFTSFWTPKPGCVEGVQDKRLDFQYALSWDAASVGSVAATAPRDIMHAAQQAQLERDVEIDPQQKRLIHVNGVYPPATFAKERDMWLHLPKENVAVLTRPIEVGERFHELPIIEQVKLAVRACQKGAMGEENLVLSIEGQKAMEEHFLRRGAPALSRQAIDAFKNLSVEEFTNAYEQLSSDEQSALQEEMMQYMLTGFFYPEKFVEYAKAAGIFRFFPQLAEVPIDEFHRQMQITLNHADYSKIQYGATHYVETGILIKNNALFPSVENFEDDFQIKMNLKKLVNPYEEVVRLLIHEADIPNGNYMEALDILLSLEHIPDAPQVSFPLTEVIDKPVEIPPLLSYNPERLIEQKQQEIAEFEGYKRFFLGAAAVSLVAGITAGVLTEDQVKIAISVVFSGINAHIAFRSHKWAQQARFERRKAIELQDRQKHFGDGTYTRESSSRLRG